MKILSCRYCRFLLFVLFSGESPGQTLTVLDGLQLWVKADAGVTADAEGLVSEWRDQTANANHAAQFDLNMSPVLVPDAANGKPAIRFDGVDDYLEIPDSDSVSFTGDLTSFFVIRLDDFVTYRAVWAKTSGHLPAPVDWYTLPGTGVPRLFRGDGGAGLGSVDGAAPLRLNTFITAGFELSGEQVTHYLSGQPSGGGVINAVPADADTPLIIGSRGDNFTKMKGDIAEIVIYDRVLTVEERAAVMDYLQQRYDVPATVSLAAEPAGPVLPMGQTVTLSATAADPDGAVESVRFYSNGGLLATATAPPYTVKVTLDSTGVYRFTARATDNRGAVVESAAAERMVTEGGDAALDVLTDLSLWVRADAGVTTGEGNAVTQWTDQSGQNNHALSADEFTAPALVADGLNGKPVLRFDGEDDALTVEDADSVSFPEDITSFFVVKLDDFATYRAVWAKTAGHLPAPVDYYTLPNTGIPRVFRGDGGAGLRSLDAPAPLRAGAFELAGFSSAGDNLSHFLNGRLNGSSDGPVQKLDLDTPLLIGTREDGVTRLKGDLAELVIYNAALTPENRRKVELYLARKYALALTSTVNAAPAVSLAAPAAGATFAAPAEVTLTAAATDEDGSLVQVEFLVNGTVAATSTTAPFQATVNFAVAGAPVLAVRATDNFGAVTVSAPVNITVTSGEAPVLPDFGNLSLWLKADAGVTQTAGAVSAWSDQSANLNQALQAIAGKQPQLVENELNGKPVLRFDGVDDDLAAASSPSLANAGNISSFFVARFDDFTTFRAVWAKTQNNEPRATDFYTLPDTGIPQVYRGGAGGIQAVPAQVPLTEGEFVVVGFDMNGTVLHHFLNGELTGEGIITSVMQDTGRPLFIGTRDDGFTRMKGDIAEIIIYNSALSDADRAQVINYLGTKYGIAVSNVSTQPPPLAISVSGNNVTLSWPAEATGYLLEASDTMEADSWFEVFDVNGNTVTEPRVNRNFYRLRRQIPVP